MRKRLALLVLTPIVLTLGGVSTASAAPTSGAPANAHGQCVSESAKAGGAGGRSTVAREKGTCTPPLRCTENEFALGTVTRNSRENTVTVAGSGPKTAGSALECRTNIPVVTGDEITFSYELGEDTDPCGGGVPRIFIVVEDEDGKTTVENTFDDNPDCVDGNVSYTIETTGTVTQVGFVYDRGDTGSVTYSNAKIDGITLNI